MSLELFLKSLSAALIGKTASSSASNNISRNSTINDQAASSGQIQQVKCYVGISSGRRNVPYKIDDLLSGKMDALFKSKTSDVTNPSPLFTCHYKIFPANSVQDKKDAGTSTGSRVCGKNTAYLLEVGCAPEEVAAIAAKGEFSKIIIRAFNAEQFVEVVLGHFKKDISQIEVHNGKLLLDSPLPRDPSPPPQRV